MSKPQIIKYLRAAILWALIAALCCACTRKTAPPPEKTPAPSPTATIEADEERVLTHFKDMVYHRASAQEAADAATELTSRIDGFDDIDELKTEFDEVDELYRIYDAMYALALIKASMDRSDAYWVEEERVMLEGYPALDKAAGELIIGLYESPFKEGIESEWDEGFFDHIENAYFTNDVTKPLYEREAALESEQKDRLALAAIEFNGKTLTYEDIQSLDDYFAWSEASLIWYEEYNEEFAKRYIELVKTRNEIAKALGFESYSDYALQRELKDYTSDMARALIDDIASELVPIYRELQRKGRYWPEPDMNFDGFIDFLGETLSSIHPEMSDALSVMLEYGLYDMEPRAFKEGGAFTMYIADYELPFIMGTYTDDLYSMSTVTHEFGHFYYTYVSMLDPPANNDLSEVHSQAMELFVANRYKDCFGDDMAYEMLYDSLFRTFITIIGQPYYTSFELRAYELGEDELTVDTLNSMALEEAARFGVGSYFQEYTMYDWVTIPHIFERPLSTFGYVTSAIAAVELWEMSLEDESGAVEKYQKLVHREGDGEFVEVLKNAGLKSPFDEGRVDEIALWAQKYLLNEDFR